MDLEIADALWQQANAFGHAGLELEFRLGHVLAGGHFSPNVGKEPFCKLQTMLNSSTAFERVVDIETLEKIADVKHVTTLSITDSLTDNPPPPSYCMTKNKVFQRDFQLPEGPYTIRCGIAVEKIVPLKQVASSITRHKRRRRYVYQCWAFDLTEVVSNTDVDTEETYEVEIELLDTGMLFERTMDHVAGWGLALVDDVVKMLQSA